jgi:siroheme synthase-like protein
MALFPFFMNIENKVGIITGGGKHALEKIERILPYRPKLTVFETEFRKEILENENITLVNRKLEEADLDELPAFVIVAGEDDEENHRIAKWCNDRRIMVNVVDDQPYCDFIFPSLISHGNLSVGISTNGASPATGVLLKRKMEAQIPENIEEILDFLQEKRPAINQAFTNKKQRFQFYYQISELCMSLNRPLSEAEFKELLIQA